jgi:S1-C subfamily serine protease
MSIDRQMTEMKKIYLHDDSEASKTSIGQDGLLIRETGRMVTTMNLADAIDYVKPSVTQIAVKYKMSAEAPLPTVVGTGFWVDESGLALTAKHVIEAARKVEAENEGSEIIITCSVPRISTPQMNFRGSYSYSYPADIVEEDPRHDLALIKARTNPFLNRPILINTGNPETLETENR